MPWIQKTNPRSWGSSITPNFEGLGVSPEVVIAFLNGLKKKDGEMEPTVSQIWKLQPPRIHQEVEPEPDASLDAAQPERDVPSGSRQPTGGTSVGPIMKVKHFRIHAVTDQTILFNWALIYAPDGIGVPKFAHLVSTANRGTAAVCDCFGHLSCFLQARGCQSPKVLQPTREEPQSG